MRHRGPPLVRDTGLGVFARQGARLAQFIVRSLRYVTLVATYVLCRSAPKGLRQEFTELRETLVRLPSVIRQIVRPCFIDYRSVVTHSAVLDTIFVRLVVFGLTLALMAASAWLGWFPVLFYSTVYIGDLHKISSPIPQTKDAAIALDVEATRLGTRAMFYSALVSLAANIIMPSFVAPQHTRHASSPLEPKRKTWSERVRMHLASLWALSHFIFATCMAATLYVHHPSFDISGDRLTADGFGFFLPYSSLKKQYSVTSTVSGATLIIAVTGFCWAMTQWAPFALVSKARLRSGTAFGYLPLTPYPNVSARRGDIVSPSLG